MHTNVRFFYLDRGSINKKMNEKQIAIATVRIDDIVDDDIFLFKVIVIH